MVLRVLREVRLREQEYEFVKDIASNIESLPSAHLLAQRERRLLWHGAASIDVHSFPKVNASSKIDSRPSSSDIRDSRPKGPTWQRSSRLFDVIGSRGNQRHHLPSSGSSSSFPSSESFETSSSVPSTCASEVYHRTGNNAPRIVVEGCSSEDIAAHAAAGGKSILVGRNTIQLLVFMDIVVLSTPSTFSREPHKFVDARWKLLEGYGFSRLFGIIDNGKQYRCDDCSFLKLWTHLCIAEGSITLELLPLSPSQLQTGVIDGETRLSSVTISLSPDTLPTERSALLAALQESHKHTVLSLSFPSFSNTYLTHGPSVDLELDTQRSLKAIMDSGLPLPKSPSVQEWEKMSKTSTRAEDGPNHFDDPVEGERQERGWWTLRFQQVLREMQRKEPTIAMDLDIHMKTTRTGARI